MMSYFSNKIRAFYDNINNYFMNNYIKTLYVIFS